MRCDALATHTPCQLPVPLLCMLPACRPRLLPPLLHPPAAYSRSLTLGNCSYRHVAAVSPVRDVLLLCARCGSAARASCLPPCAAPAVAASACRLCCWVLCAVPPPHVFDHTLTMNEHQATTVASTMLQCERPPTSACPHHRALQHVPEEPSTHITSTAQHLCRHSACS